MVESKIFVTIFLGLCLHIVCSVDSVVMRSQRDQAPDQAAPGLYSPMGYSEQAYHQCAQPVQTISNTCSSSLKTFNKKQCYQLFDSWGKPPSGIMTSAWHWVGDYDQCMSITGLGTHPVYCTAKLAKLHKIFPELFDKKDTEVHMGVCLPGLHCSVSDVNELIASFLGMWNMTHRAGSGVNVTSLECENKKLYKLNAAGIVVICIIAFVLLLVLIGTLYDFLVVWILQKRNPVLRVVSDSDAPDPGIAEDGGNATDRNQLLIASRRGESSFLHELFLCFSLYGNFRRVMKRSSTYGNQGKQLHCLHGIRVLSMFYIIFGHTFYYAQFYFKIDGREMTKRIQKDFMYQLVNGATQAVDTFFLISGLLQAYLLLGSLRLKNGPMNINWGILIFHRIWRLTPTYMILLAFYATLFPLMGQGPFWPQNAKEAAVCQDVWWHNLLYVNNLIPYKSGHWCMGWTWYLGDEFQFFLISPLFILLLYWKPTLGVLTSVATILASATARAVVSAKGDYPPGFIGMSVGGNIRNDYVTHYMETFYYPPWMRIGPFLIGILTGYLFYKYDNIDRWPKVVWILGWLVSLAVMFSVIFGLHHMAVSETLPPNYVSALYNAIARIVWAAAVSFITIACVSGKGGYISAFLSLEQFELLSNLTFMAYLIHPIVIRFYFGNFRQTLVFNYETLLFLFVGFTTLGYFFGLCAHIILESPTMTLEKIMFKRLHSCLSRRDRRPAAQNHRVAPT